jgi:hypothetical protein
MHQQETVQLCEKQKFVIHFFLLEALYILLAVTLFVSKDFFFSGRMYSLFIIVSEKINL